MRTLRDVLGMTGTKFGIVWGVTRQTPSGPVTMPGFGNSYSDAEIAILANYVTARFGASPSRITSADVARIRQEASQ